jgi:hypothetical protein
MKIIRRKVGRYSIGMSVRTLRDMSERRDIGNSAFSKFESQGRILLWLYLEKQSNAVIRTLLTTS